MRNILLEKKIFASLDRGQKISRLTISNLQLGDAAVFFCAIRSGTAQSYKIGRKPYKNVDVVEHGQAQRCRAQRELQKMSVR